MIKSYQIDQLLEYPHIGGMLLHEVTGRQLRDARHALGLSLAGLATRAGVNRMCIRLYESHGDDVPNAHTHVLGRLTRALQDQGVEFLPNGSVCLQRLAPTTRDKIVSDETNE